MSDDAAQPMTAEQVQQASTRFRDDFEAVRSQVARAVVGQTSVIEQTLVCLFVGGHALLEGVPGIGKTLLVRRISEAVDLSFGRVQFTPDLMPADITGTTVIDESEGDDGRMHRSFRFQPGPVFSQILLADEINRATPKTQSALLEAMQERSVTVGGTTHALPKPFFVLATQNPVEQEGTYPLPEAQLDRFFFKLHVDYPSRADLHTILDRTTGEKTPEAQPVLDQAGIIEMQKLVREVPASRSVQDYAVRLIQATHPQHDDADPDVKRFVNFGSSPRGAQAVLLAAKITALYEDRFAPGIEDVKKVAVPALRHRVLLNFEGEAEGVKTDQLLQRIIKKLPESAK